MFCTTYSPILAWKYESNSNIKGWTISWALIPNPKRNTSRTKKSSVLWPEMYAFARSIITIKFRSKVFKHEFLASNTLKADFGGTKKF